MKKLTKQYILENGKFTYTKIDDTDTAKLWDWCEVKLHFNGFIFTGSSEFRENKSLAKKVAMEDLQFNFINTISLLEGRIKIIRENVEYQKKRREEIDLEFKQVCNSINKYQHEMVKLMKKLNLFYEKEDND